MLQIPRMASVILGVFKKCSRQFVGHTHDQQIIYANICKYMRDQINIECLFLKVLLIYKSRSKSHIKLESLILAQDERWHS